MNDGCGGIERRLGGGILGGGRSGGVGRLGGGGGGGWYCGGDCICGAVLNGVFSPDVEAFRTRSGSCRSGDGKTLVFSAVCVRELDSSATTCPSDATLLTDCLEVSTKVEVL